MITREKKLQIFENFVVDSNLKKKVQNNEGEKGDTSDNWIPINQISLGSSGLSYDGITYSENLRITEYLKYVYQQNRTIINWCKLKFAGYFLKTKIKKNFIKFQPIEDFFNDVHNSVKELNLDEKSIEFYIETISTANENGQQALVEILTSKKDALLKELSLVTNTKLIGGVKYVTESDIVNFYEKTKSSARYLKLTWMKNYSRVIPTNVIATKKEYDDFYAFDNYVVLHFDKNNDSTQMTQKEIEKAKDPILFGVIRGSDKLYYIGDWVDEYCDLTLNVLIETLEQKKVRELTKESITKEITN